MEREGEEQAKERVQKCPWTVGARQRKSYSCTVVSLSVISPGVLSLWPNRGVHSGSKRAKAKVLKNYPQMVVFFNNNPHMVA